MENREKRPVTMYKNNSRNSSKIKGCSPLQLSYSLTGKCHAVGYYSYTYRYHTFPNQHIKSRKQKYYCFFVNDYLILPILSCGQVLKKK